MTPKDIFQGFLVFAFILIYHSPSAQETYLTEKWEMLELGTYLGDAGLISVDLNNDGNEEIVMSASIQSATYFCILELKEDEFAVKWSSRMYEVELWQNVSIRKIKVYNLDQDNDYEIYVMTGNGILECYDGTTMEILYTKELACENPNDFIFDDLDGDGDTELIISSDHWDSGKYIKIYNAVDFSMEWETTTFGSVNIEAGDVDNDSVTELVLANGVVIDGTSHEIDWIYNEAFGREIELADVNGDQVLDIIGGKSDYIYAYNGQTQELLWEIFTDKAFDGLLTTDLEGDGEIEIIFGNSNFDGLLCYSSLTLELIWESDNQHSGVTQICIGDPDNDTEKEIIWGTGQRSSGSDHLIITTANSGIKERETTDLDGYFSVEITDIDKDTQFEIGISSYETNNYYNGGHILLYDGMTHNLKAVLDSLSFISPINCMKIVNINSSEQDEIILGFSDGYGYKSIMILDGLSYEILYEENDFGSIYSLDVADIDNDGVVEIVFGVHYGAISVMNGETYEIEWETQEWGWQNNVRQILLQNLDSDPALEIIYWTNNDKRILAYDGLTKTEQAVSEQFELMKTIDVADINMDGEMEVCIADENGHVTALNSTLDNIVTQFYLQDEPIYSIKFCNIDSSIHKEIICGSPRLRVFSGDHHILLWESRKLNEDELFNINKQEIEVFNIDQDDQMDVFWANDRGVFHYECNETFIDYSPSFQNPTAQWSVADTYPNANPQNPNFVETITTVYGFIGDTLIAGEKWLKFYSTTDSNFMSDLTYKGIIREEGGNVAFMNTANSIDTIYNFNLQVGDSVPYDFGFGIDFLQIESIDSIELAGEYYLRFHFAEPFYPPFHLKEIWIEGIGSIHGPLFPLSPELFSNEIPDSTKLTCYKQDNLIIWNHPSYENCYVSIVLSTEEFHEEQLRIYPNPVKDILKLEIPGNESVDFVVTVYDIFGKKIFRKNYKQTKTVEINSTSLDVGLYILEIEIENKFYRQKFVKE